MKELVEVALPQLKVFLVGKLETNESAFFLQTTDETADTTHYALAELTGLVHNLDMQVCGNVVLRRKVCTAPYAVGTGQAANIIAQAKDVEADCIIFDFDISPTQLRNWERDSGLTIYDRQGIIILIFASRAHTKEAVLQVELAKLEYALPRLAHTYHSLSRQRGGSYGSKGAGESKLELDRREIQQKIIDVKKDIIRVRQIRSVQRRKRLKTPVSTAALVGYTNAGKSSLLNVLTNSAVMTKDALFATLDPSTRRMESSNGMTVLISDTVGFIRNLPHSLVEAFHATLEEAVLADILLIVLDASDPEIQQQYDTTIAVLHEIGADQKTSIVVLNKIDRIAECNDSITDERFSLQTLFPGSIPVSAATGSGLEDLRQCLYAQLGGKTESYVVPLASGSLIGAAYDAGCVESVEWTDSAILLSAKLPSYLKSQFAPFLQK